MQSSFNQENQLILMKQTSENKLFNSIKRIDDKESSWIAWESLKNSRNRNTFLINNILSWRLNTWSYIFINIVEHHHSLDLVLSSNFIMLKRSFIKERFEEFRSRFSQISETDSSKLSSAESFINEDDESFAETVILFVSIENWKTRCMILDRETDWLNELSKQQDNKIKKLKTRLQTKEITSSDFIYFERSRSQKIPDSFWFTDEKNSTWKNLLRP